MQALRHYGATAGPHQARAADLHQQLRHSLLANIVGQYSSTGYLWEQYDDTTGAGGGLELCFVLVACSLTLQQSNLMPLTVANSCNCYLKLLLLPLSVCVSAGQGQGSHPFTGWTALLALLAADR